MELIQVDVSKCIKCGICVDCCPSCILSMGDEGPECLFDRGCMSCGHCVAICPKGALTNKYTPLEEQQAIEGPVLPADQVYDLLRRRRSIRNFKTQPPTRDEVTRLLDVCRYAPTAGNSQGLSYLVLSDQQLIGQVADTVATWMEEEIAANSPNKRYYRTVLQVYRERHQDIIARHAPLLIFAYARRLNTTGVSNAEQAWAYAELFAPSLGLGTTIAGFIQTCGIAGYQPLLDLVGIPDKHNLVGCLMVGYPKYKYYRLPERQPLKLTFR